MNKEELVFELCDSFVSRFDLKTEFDAISLCESPVRKFVWELVELIRSEDIDV
jgi:hypothetical protein